MRHNNNMNQPWVFLSIIICLLFAFNLVLHASNALADCRVNDRDISGFYSGGCVNGVAHGKGIAKGRDTYEGEFKNGNKHGKGTYTWGTEEFAERSFVGECIDDEFVKGVSSHRDGVIMEGSFKNLKLTGSGTIKIPKELLPDQNETKDVKLVGNFWVAQGLFRDGQLTSDDAEDKRTPLEKYQGAYTGAWLLCTLSQKMVFLTEKSKIRGIALDKDKTKSDADVSACIESGLAEMKKEYNNIQPLVKNPEGKKALQEHYVAAIMHVKGTHSRPKENDTDFTERMNETKRKIDELWVRFEITQP